MWRKLFIPAIASLAVVFMLTGNADAQRRGGGRLGGWSGGNWNRGGIGLGYGGYGYGGYGYNRGYYPNYGSYYGRNYYSTPYYAPYYASEVYSYPSYYSGPTYAAPVYSAPVSNTANIRILVPDPNARVWFDNTLTQQTGTERIFATPPLDGSASYRIRASWIQGGQEVIRDQTVAITPGAEAVVDFR